MMKFEYKTMRFGAPSCTGIEEWLNKAGHEGWELVSATPYDGSDMGICGIMLFLKREVIDK